MFCLVREFLEYFDLDFTASVYDPESYVGSFYKYEGRQKVIDDLGLQSEDLTGPVLFHIVKIAQLKSKTLKINLTNINGDQESNLSSSASSVQEQVNGHSADSDSPVKNDLNSTYVLKKENGEVEDNPVYSAHVKKNENDDTFNGTSSIEEESVSANGDVSHKSTSNDEEASTTPEQESSPESKSKSEDKTKKLKKLELPPLQLSKPRGSDLLPSLYKKSKEYDFEIKDDYEEDFMSGSEIELSQSRIDSPKPLFEELQQCSEHTTNGTSTSKKKTPDNKYSNSTNIETNLSVDETSSHNLDT